MSSVVRRGRIPLVVAGLLVGGLMVNGGGADATHQPADKIAVSGAAMEVMSAPLVEGASSSTVSLLTATLRTSAPTDLLFDVSAECALWTDITTRTVDGFNDSSAEATVKVWVEFDGVPVAVSADDATETGKVVFCNRMFRQKVTQQDDDEDDHVFEQFIRSRSANSFNWTLLNAGAGVHTIEVKADLQALVNGVGDAKAAVGKRSLVVVPAKLANDASF